MAQVGSNSSGSLFQSNLSANGIVYADSSGVINSTSVGTSGQVLTSNGAGVAPTFQAAAGGSSAWVLISSQVVTGTPSTLSFTVSATYNNYVLLVSNYTPVTTTQNLVLQINTGGGFITSGYLSGINYSAYNTATFINSALTTGFLLAHNVNATDGFNGMFNLLNFTSGGINPAITGTGSADVLGNISIMGGVYNANSTIVSSFQVFSASGNLNTGTFSLYGILE